MACCRSPPDVWDGVSFASRERSENFVRNLELLVPAGIYSLANWHATPSCCFLRRRSYLGSRTFSLPTKCSWSFHIFLALIKVLEIKPRNSQWLFYTSTLRYCWASGQTHTQVSTGLSAR